MESGEAIFGGEVFDNSNPAGVGGEDQIICDMKALANTQETTPLSQRKHSADNETARLKIASFQNH